MTLCTCFYNYFIYTFVYYNLNLSYLKKKKLIINSLKTTKKSWTLVLKVPTLFPKIRKKFFILIVIKRKNYPPKADVKKIRRGKIPMFLNFSPWSIEINDW